MFLHLFSPFEGAPAGDLSCGFRVGNSRATGKRVVSESRLPVPGNNQLRAIEELGLTQERSRQIGAVEHCFEKVRPLNVSTRQTRVTQIRSSQIGIP